MKLVIPTKKIAVALILVVLLLSFASLAAQFFMYFWGREGLLSFLPLFDVGEDANIPTWYSSFALLLCSVLLATIAAAEKRRGDRYALHWGVLAGIFLLLSIDEVATIHEHMQGIFVGLIRAIGFTDFTPSGFLYYAWVIPGAIFVIIVALAYLRFVADLPRRIRRLFLVAGALFVAGALGIEMLSAQLISSHGGVENWAHIPSTIKIVAAIETALEELLEMLGVVVFIYALLSYVSTHVEEVTVQVRADND